jgi:hypothetical protein
VFAELVFLLATLAEPNFSLEVLMTREEEVRCKDSRKRRYGGGGRLFVCHIIPLAAHALMVPSAPADTCVAMFPFNAHQHAMQGWALILHSVSVG